MTTTTLAPKLKARTFLPLDFKITDWAALEPYFTQLQKQTITSVTELEQWLKQLSELETVISEDIGWRYIKMTCDTTNKAIADSYNYFVEHIAPHIEPFTDEFNKKLIASPFLNELDKEKYKIYLREVKNDLDLFRTENIPLFTKLSTEEQKYGTISADMTVTIDGKELTLQQASIYLKENDSEKRELVWRMIQDRKQKDVTVLDNLFNELIALRQQVAANTGFDNFRDYKHKALGRFDYSVADCFTFHDAIESEIMPLISTFDKQRKKEMHTNVLRPWDLDVDSLQRKPLKPFTDGVDLLDKSIACFHKVKKQYGEYLEVMKVLQRVDLDSRKGKAPGGYNYPLNETGVPFIFMNSSGLLRDLITMVHEGGHAIHAFLSNNLELDAFKQYPSEVAELASMSMELISMEYWDVFFEDKEELKRARKEHLEKMLRILPWIAAIDKFQHWIYTNKNHTAEQRSAAWTQIITKLSSAEVDWSGLEQYRAVSWQSQLHLYEVPFYYIEYGIAQLGAIAIWRNYKQHKEKALAGYEAALSLGYTKSIPEIYAAANVKFDFSKEYIHELVEFVKDELNKL